MQPANQNNQDDAQMDFCREIADYFAFTLLQIANGQNNKQSELARHALSFATCRGKQLGFGKLVSNK